jgi:hypothetical protein
MNTQGNADSIQVGFEHVDGKYVAVYKEYINLDSGGVSWRHQNDYTEVYM